MYSGKLHFSGDYVLRDLWTHLIRFVVDAGWTIHRVLPKEEGVSSYDISHDIVVEELDTWIDLPSADAYEESFTPTLQEGVDYEINRPLGRVRFLSGGSVTAGQTVHIDYQWKREGVILFSPGYSGEEQIYVGLRPFIDTDGVHGRIELKAYLGFQEEMEFEDTTLGEPLNKYSLELWSGETDLWIFVSPQRIIGVDHIQGYYGCFYLGLLNRLCLPHEYPYPLCIISSDCKDYDYASTSDHRRFFPDAHNVCFVTPDNRWNAYLSHEWNSPFHFLPLQADTGYLEQIHYPESAKRALLPVYLWWHEEEILGELEGVYLAPGAISSSESEITAGDDTYICFENVFRHEWKDFMAILEA